MARAKGVVVGGTQVEGHMATAAPESGGGGGAAAVGKGAGKVGLDCCKKCLNGMRTFAEGYNLQPASSIGAV